MQNAECVADKRVLQVPPTSRLMPCNKCTRGTIIEAQVLLWRRAEVTELNVRSLIKLILECHCGTLSTHPLWLCYLLNLPSAGFFDLNYCAN
jgi:hypothetical protein